MSAKSSGWLPVRFGHFEQEPAAATSFSSVTSNGAPQLEHELVLDVVGRVARCSGAARAIAA
jgi:hypothetical protein